MLETQFGSSTTGNELHGIVVLGLFVSSRNHLKLNLIVLLFALFFFLRYPIFVKLSHLYISGPLPSSTIDGGEFSLKKGALREKAEGVKSLLEVK